jgi:hypothetical protein
MRPRGLVGHDLRRQAGQGQVLVGLVACTACSTAPVSERSTDSISFMLDVLLQARDQLVEVRATCFSTRGCISAVHRAGEEVDGGLLAAAEAGAVAAGIEP